MSEQPAAPAEETVADLKAKIEQIEAEKARLQEEVVDANDSVTAARFRSSKIEEDSTTYLKGQVKLQRQVEALGKLVKECDEEIKKLTAMVSAPKGKGAALTSSSATALTASDRLPDEPGQPARNRRERRAEAA